MPSPTDIANLKLWCKGDAGFGATADHASLAAWLDQSGLGNDLTQGTGANKPVYDAVKGLVVSELGQGANQYFNAPGSFTLDRQNFSFFCIVDIGNLRAATVGASTNRYHFFCEASGDTLNLLFDGSTGRLQAYDGAFKVSTTIPFTTNRCLIGWVGTAGALTCYLDGVGTTAAALSAGSSTLSTLLGALGGANGASDTAFRDLIIYGAAVSASDVTNTLLPYARTRGVPASRMHQLVLDGDSITQGYQSLNNRNWASKLALPSSIRFRNTAESGITLATLSSGAAAFVDPLFIASETNVLTIFAGTNDLANAGATGAATYAALVSYCGARRSAGYKVVVFTMLPRTLFNGTQNGYRTTYNSNIIANWASFADGLVDMTTEPALSDSTDAAYFADGIHPTDAGYAVIASLARPVIAGLFPAPAGSGAGPGGLHRLCLGLSL